MLALEQALAQISRRSRCDIQQIKFCRCIQMTLLMRCTEMTYSCFAALSFVVGAEAMFQENTLSGNICFLANISVALLKTIVVNSANLVVKSA